MGTVSTKTGDELQREKERRQRGSGRESTGFGGWEEREERGGGTHLLEKEKLLGAGDDGLSESAQRTSPSVILILELIRPSLAVG